MKNRVKNVIMSILAGAVLFGVMSGMTYAAGTLTASMENSGLYKLTLHHDYSDSRYCELAISTGSSASTATCVGFASGTLSPNVEMHLNRMVTGQYGYGLGVVYFGQTPYSTVVWSDHTEHANPNYGN